MHLSDSSGLTRAKIPNFSFAMIQLLEHDRIVHLWSDVELELVAYRFKKCQKVLFKFSGGIK
jgi:hypothetical protein